MRYKTSEILLTFLAAPEFDGSFPPEFVETLLATHGGSVEALMLDLLPVAAERARPAVSNFHVGAVLLGSSGRIYLGANFEFAALGLHATIHAEQCAVANAYMHQETGLAALAVTASPCGLCRQFLWEFCAQTNLHIHLPNSPRRMLSELLPSAFGPADLGVRRPPLPPDAIVTTQENMDLMAAAIEASRLSYAPYTGQRSGLAVKTAEGKMFRGATIENAAYNPSLSAWQVACCCLTAAGEHADQVIEVAIADGEALEPAISIVFPAISAIYRFPAQVPDLRKSP